MKQVLLSWSSGKDSAWALHMLRQQRDLRIAALLTTFNGAADRVAMHGIRRCLVEAQAERIGLPLWAVDLPWPCSNAEYEKILRGICNRAVDEDIEAVAFGDLFLADIRSYRERQLKDTGLEPIFPLWQIPTTQLARDMVRSGIKAKLSCVDVSKLDRSYAGRNFDFAFLENLGPEIDPCGENGEFHTFVYDAPIFPQPIGVQVGEIVERDGFAFADVIEVDSEKPEIALRISAARRER